MASNRELGVLHYNNDIRNIHLQRNLPRYFQYEGIFNPAIGEYYEINTRPLQQMTNGKGLLEYTHDGDSVYSKTINHQYTNGKGVKDVNVYEVENSKDVTNIFTNENDYINYYRNVYALEDTVPRFINKLLDVSSLDLTMNMFRPSIVEEILPYDSLNGRVVTNVNNNHNTDTRLGLISNQAYAKTLIKGSVVNTQRLSLKRGISGVGYDNPTNGLYGNNILNINNLNGLFVVPKTGRIDGEIMKSEIVDKYVFNRRSKDWVEPINLNTQYIDEAMQPSINGLFLQIHGTDSVLTSIDKPYYFSDNAYYESKYGARRQDGRVYLTDWCYDTLNYDRIFNDADTIEPFATFGRYNFGKIIHIVYNANGDNNVNVLKNRNVSVDKTTISEFDSFRAIDKGISFEDVGEDDDYDTHVKKSLLGKTDQIFRHHKVHTIYGEHPANGLFGFNDFYDDDSELSPYDSAKTELYGHSKGRNLLARKSKRSFYNPYCRTWTHYHQYSTINRQIRPFSDGDKAYDMEALQKNMNGKYRSSIVGNENYKPGWKYLAENTVLHNDSGKVNVAPSKAGKVDIKKCMFSIENLAWKDVPEMNDSQIPGFPFLSKEQRGPNGGRIMWFPPYDLSFDESVNAEYNDNTFVGRGEPIHTYRNTTRNGNLSFTIIVDHPAVINSVHNSQGDVNDVYFPDEDDTHKVTDWDILRFFAGCDPLFIKDNEEKPNEYEEPVPQPEPPQPEEGEVSTAVIYVFYPNNYSGNMVTPPTKEDMKDPLEGYDNDAYEYLYGGDCINVSGGNGYEMNTDGISGATKCNQHGISMNENWEVTPKNESEKTSLVESECIVPCKKYSQNLTPCAAPIDGEEYIKRTTGPVKNWQIYRYRVDFDLHQRELNKGTNAITGITNNYQDTQSYGLNKKHEYYVEHLNLSDTATTEYYSFSEMYEASQNLNENDERVQSLNDILEGKSGEIVNIKFFGGATNQDNPNTKKLAQRRCTTLKNYIKQHFTYIKDNPSLITDGINITADDESNKRNPNDNYIQAKRIRYAKCVITYRKTNTSRLNETLSGGTSTNDSGGVSANIVDTNINTDKNNGLSSGSKVGNDSQAPLENRLSTSITKRFDNVSTRYETESEYFHKLKHTDPVIFKSIVDKIKYFDPAFHSITPEGFNARLTFLQQCTRQGPTLESISTKSNISAGNLAFGRMPVCVLRIGDFINTRIIVKSISIAYSSDGMHWDLNPEGIGVQPMYAKVNMAITFIGGQTLEGPISRLQNAVSFNYYANTGVYDNRADRVEINRDGWDDKGNPNSLKTGEARYSEKATYLWEAKNKSGIQNDAKKQPFNK